jgi:HAD superfamily hydrolase (TIGR01490 family)
VISRTTTATAAPLRAAFFDVDETLIAAKSMFAFLRFWLAQRGDDGSDYRIAFGRLSAMASEGVDRSAINGAYYRLFAGVTLAELLDAGETWYAQLCSEPEPFVAATLAALARHRTAGHAIVLVSGSFRPCLEPLAAHVGAHTVVCTEPVVDDDGRLTGEVRRPMIGARKASAVAEVMAALAVCPAHCYAYADHASDVDMLSLVGHGVVIGRDPVLTSRAGSAGWRLLSPSRGPAPASAPASSPC